MTSNLIEKAGVDLLRHRMRKLGFPLDDMPDAVILAAVICMTDHLSEEEDSPGSFSDGGGNVRWGRMSSSRSSPTQ